MTKQLQWLMFTRLLNLILSSNMFCSPRREEWRLAHSAEKLLCESYSRKWSAGACWVVNGRRSTWAREWPKNFHALIAWREVDYTTCHRKKLNVLLSGSGEDPVEVAPYLSTIFSRRLHTSENVIQLDCRSGISTRIINLPTNQKGYDTFKTIVGKLLARRIQIFPVHFCLGIILKVILNNFQNNA